MHEDDQGRKYYASKTTLKTQWQHPMEEYYKGVVFMRKEGEQLLEEKASRSPPTPEETREMARYFGRGGSSDATRWGVLGGVLELGSGRGGGVTGVLRHQLFTRGCFASSSGICATMQLVKKYLVVTFCTGVSARFIVVFARVCQARRLTRAR